MQAQLESEQFPMGMRDQWRRGDSSDGFWWRDDGSFSSQAQERSGAVHQVSRLSCRVLVCAWRVRRVSLAFLPCGGAGGDGQFRLLPRWLWDCSWGWESRCDGAVRRQPRLSRDSSKADAVQQPSNPAWTGRRVRSRPPFAQACPPSRGTRPGADSGTGQPVRPCCSVRVVVPISSGSLPSAAMPVARRQKPSRT